MYDFSNVIEHVQSSFGKNEKRKLQIGLGSQLSKLTDNPEDYVVMQEGFPFDTYYGPIGLPFGKIVQLSGQSDSGKTTFALMAIKAAIEQGHIPIYVETEEKTTVQDFVNHGIDPDQVILIEAKIIEEIFDNVNALLDGLSDTYPEAKFLLVIDSFGQTLSQHSADLKLADDKSKPGGKGSVNRLGLESIVARQSNMEIAVLVINYTYDNIGGYGQIDAGGKALYLLSSLIIRCSPVSAITRQVQGKKVRVGMKVKWTVKKNHLAKSFLDEDGNQKIFPSELTMNVDANGFTVL